MTRKMRYWGALAGAITVLLIMFLGFGYTLLIWIGAVAGGVAGLAAEGKVGVAQASEWLHRRWPDEQIPSSREEWRRALLDSAWLAAEYIRRDVERIRESTRALREG